MGTLSGSGRREGTFSIIQRGADLSTEKRVKVILIRGKSGPQASWGVHSPLWDPWKEEVLPVGRRVCPQVLKRRKPEAAVAGGERLAGREDTSPSPASFQS